MKPDRTFRMDRLYFQFLKPNLIGMDQLPFLATKMFEAGFIEIFLDDSDPELERYAENPKLYTGHHKKELFKIIEGLKTTL